MNKLIYKQECYDIIGACMDVHKELGFGFLENVYHEALMYEFMDCFIPFESEVALKIKYKHRMLEKEYFADFICYEKIIVEIKALSCITGEHEAQVINYLKATGYQLGLLINFGTKSLSYKRLVLT
jgi:GxxExxY protein